MRALAVGAVLAFSLMSACSAADDEAQEHPSAAFCSRAETEFERLSTARVVGNPEDASPALEALHEAALAKGHEEMAVIVSDGLSAASRIADGPMEAATLEAIRFRHSIAEIVLRCDAAERPIDIHAVDVLLLG